MDIKRNAIHTTKSGDIATEQVIVSCPGCKQKIRVPLFKTTNLSVSCPKCRSEFKFNCHKYRITKHLIGGCLILAAITLTIVDVILPFSLIKNSNRALDQIQESYALEIQAIQNNYSNELEGFKKDYDVKIANMDVDALKRQAANNYSSIWSERLNYNSRYAITPRENAQLEMIVLSKEKNRSIEEIVESIAQKAAPNNSEIKAYTTARGVNLDVNFDMSEVTTGEIGTRTKHGTIDSLKKETIRLISKVTTDLYEFCRDLELENIAIGCKHFVTVNQQYGASVDDNIIIYKIGLDREDIKSLEHNPFLDIYAITKYFTVEKDDFPSLYLERMP